MNIDYVIKIFNLQYHKTCRIPYDKIAQVK